MGSLNAGVPKDFSAVFNSWVAHAFDFVEPDLTDGGHGLRKPQRAALFAALGHLVTSPESPATIVMPTGTGKTDTIASLIIAGRFHRTLIIVPSDALREQTKDKLEELSNLRDMRAISDNVLSPVVSLISSGLSFDQVKLLSSSNVIIATPQSLAKFEKGALGELARLCSHLIVDEAHHVAAKTWLAVKDVFSGKPCLQFTATPFREDKKGLEGNIIYNYPLKDAQKDGYFQEIHFHPVREYQASKADEVIAAKAVELLRADIALGYNHILMARAASKNKAKEIYEFYKLHADLNPVLIYSGIAKKEAILKNIKKGEHSIVVCVDMLGEGFDLPRLKLAAIHDQHISPNITLQFIGRMTRVGKGLGTAKFIANIANQNTETQLRELYTESADWSSIIRDVSQDKIEKELKKQEFREGFSRSEVSKDILALNLTPKVSTVAYHVAPENWLPERVEKFPGAKESNCLSCVSDDRSLVLLVAQSRSPVPWADSEDIYDQVWNLCVAYYDFKMKLMFVHSTASDQYALRFSNLLAKDKSKVFGEPVFRSLHNLDRLRLQNVGLSRARRDLRFTMHVGIDINEVISEIEKGTSTKSNIFAQGFEDGRKTTIGCSHKGKIWEMETASIDYWVNWCKGVGSKILNDDIEIKEILKNTMRAERVVSAWPSSLLLADWPESIYVETEIKSSLIVDGIPCALDEVEFKRPVLRSQTIIEVPLDAQGTPKSIFIDLLPDGYRYRCDGLKMVFGRDELRLESYLQEHPLFIMLCNGALLQGNFRLFSASTVNTKIPRKYLKPLDWSDIDISKESMGVLRDLGTVQGKTFRRIENDYDIIFDDDGSREVADLVAIRQEDDSIIVDFYHCKYCKKDRKTKLATSGGRVEDVYEVAGQAIRSVKWVNTGERLFTQLIKRYQKALERNHVKVLKGDIKDIEVLRNKSHHYDVRFGFNIVQPAISLAQISDEQLTVLGACYTYIKDTTGVDVSVFTDK